MNTPLVSVCIPTYNQEQFVSEALGSVLTQDYENLQILVLDDCSTDSTLEIARVAAGADARVVIQKNSANMGMVRNWNHALELSRGKYIKFLFGDDLLSPPDAIGMMVRLMESNSSLALVSSAREIIDDSNNLLSVISSFPGNFFSNGRKVIRNTLLGITRVHNPVGEPSAVMFRRDLAGRGFNGRYNQLVDIEMWFHLLEQGDFAYIDHPLCSFRQHDGQQTMKNIASLGFIDDLLMLLDDYLRKPYAGMGLLDIAYMRYYQLHKLQKHARQGKFDMDMVNSKIDTLYGRKKFASMLLFYRLYSPYWNLKIRLGKIFSSRQKHTGN